MRELPHATAFTLSTDTLMAADEMVGFFVTEHTRTIFRHFHDFYELAFVLSGTGRHVTDGGVQRLERGAAIFVAPGVAHGYELCEGLVVYNCFLRVETARLDLSWAQRDPRLGRLFQGDAQHQHRPIVASLDEAALTECLDHMDAIRSRRPAERGEAFDLGHLLLTLDIVAREVQRERLGQGAADPAAPAVVRSAVGIILDDLKIHWTLAALSKELSVDPYHLVKLFKRWLGVPPIAHANQVRAERAAIMLASTDEPIGAIGVAVGWPEPAHFSRRFRAAMGQSPRAFREASRLQRPDGRLGASIGDAWQPAYPEIGSQEDPTTSASDARIS
jgi:AraC family L-rhamnose operon transcriptional activator RhaR